MNKDRLNAFKYLSFVEKFIFALLTIGLISLAILALKSLLDETYGNEVPKIIVMLLCYEGFVQILLRGLKRGYSSIEPKNRSKTMELQIQYVQKFSLTHSIIGRVFLAFCIFVLLALVIIPLFAEI